MRRRLFTVLSGITLLGLVLTVGAVVASFVRSPELECSHRESLTAMSPAWALDVYLHQGLMQLTWMTYPAPPMSTRRKTPWRLDVEWSGGRSTFALVAYPRLEDGWQVWTFSAVRGAILTTSDNRRAKVSQYLFPFWPLAVPLALPPIGWLLLRRRRRRQARDGLCRACGYDVRATPERCPECGTFAPNPPAKVESARRVAST